MAPSSRKRRAPADDDEPEPEPEPTPAPTQRRHTQPADEDDDEMEEAEGGSGSGSLAQTSKNLVRYAISCDFSRTPMKRQDINQKVLQTSPWSFKQVLAAANAELIMVFGMCMVELPVREKVTLREKRAAAGSETQPKNSNMWVLQTVLPEQYRIFPIIGPSIVAKQDRVPDLDSAYVGLYTMVISLILLSGGAISESKLDRFMKRMNAGELTPLDTTEKTLARMVKDGYVAKIRENQGGGEVIDYMVGPRGKVEVGKESVAQFVRTVYGSDVEDLDERLQRSLGLGEAVANGANGEVQQGGPSERRGAGRPRRQRDEGEE